MVHLIPYPSCMFYAYGFIVLKYVLVQHVDLWGLMKTECCDPEFCKKKKHSRQNILFADKYVHLIKLLNWFVLQNLGDLLSKFQS